MADWADEMAVNALCDMEKDSDAKVIARALRKARADALVEAAAFVLLRTSDEELADGIHTLKDRKS